VTSKVGQTDLVFGIQSGQNAVSRSVHAILQVSVFSGYDLFHSGWHPDTHRQANTQTAFDQLLW